MIRFTKRSFAFLPVTATARLAARPAGPRADNRISLVLDAAARLFREKGYASTSMRDIAGACGMLAGSLYYHFPSKEALLVAVYAEGVAHIRTAVATALERDGDAWQRLERACAAHLEALLSGSDYAQVVVRVRPDDAPDVAAELTALRDEYERTFAQAIGALPLARAADKRTLKLMLLGALNWSQTWYRPGGDAPAVVARRFVRLLRDPQSN
jgi:TetR/AcrR family transcriptional regulator, cholesterol catabolism regulator